MLLDATNEEIKGQERREVRGKGNKRLRKEMTR